MDVIVERCAGLDVHRDSVVATVRVPGKGKSRRRRAQRTRTFATTIAQLEQLADWLEGFGVTLVGMEATGVYWKPVFWVLERRFECWLINAEHLHNVPGRKSDVIDSRWCCELLELGLVRPSFVPPPEIRRLRDLTRLRSTQVEERTRAIQLLGEYQGPEQLTGPDGLINRLRRRLIERAAGAELEQHLGYPPGVEAPEAQPNRRNGTTSKTLRTVDGPLSVELPRDRDASFEPRIVPKHGRSFDGFDEQILALY